jgi:hypothetical protein
MNNYEHSYNPLKFKSEEEARLYFKNNDVESYMSYLGGQVDSLIEQSRLEVPQVMGHGYPAETSSGFTASYISSEITRLNDMLKYFRGDSPRPGYKWVWSNHGNQEVHQHLDLENADHNHPVFIEYISNQKLNEAKIKEVFDFWLDCHKNPTLNKSFKLAYMFKMENLIPDGVKLVKLMGTPKKSKRRKS